MTVAGHATLEAELKNLKSVERPYIINAISVAREHGDLSENAEYHAAKEKQGFHRGANTRAREQVIACAGH